MGNRSLFYGFVVFALAVAGLLGLLGILTVPVAVWIAGVVAICVGIVACVIWDLYGGRPID